MLRNKKDVLSLLYLLGSPALVYLNWVNESTRWLVFPLTIILQMGICSINHNHGHVPIWKSKLLNTLIDYYLCLVQGCPNFMLQTAHISSHHRYNQSENDVTRVAQYSSGNNFWEYLIFPLKVLKPLNNLKKKILKELKTKDRKAYMQMQAQYVCILALWIPLFYLDWKKTLIFILIPQFIGIHFLLASNYLQHAKAEVGSEFNHSRNFVGLMNLLFFNVGYHTAHHQYENVHWSQLPTVHDRLKDKIEPRLNVKSFLMYYLYDLTFLPLTKLFKFN